MLTAYEQIANTTLYPGDPVRLFLESVAYVIALQNNVINLAGRQNLLAYAQGDHLDYIGMMVGTQRLGAGYAICTQRFELSATLGFDVQIPAGTRVTTSDRKSLFAVDALGIIRAGSFSGSPSRDTRSRTPVSPKPRGTRRRTVTTSPSPGSGLSRYRPEPS